MCALSGRDTVVRVRDNVGDTVDTSIVTHCWKIYVSTHVTFRSRTVVLSSHHLCRSSNNSTFPMQTFQAQHRIAPLMCASYPWYLVVQACHGRCGPDVWARTVRPFSTKPCAKMYFNFICVSFSSKAICWCPCLLTATAHLIDEVTQQSKFTGDMYRHHPLSNTGRRCVEFLPRQSADSLTVAFGSNEQGLHYIVARLHRSCSAQSMSV